MRKKIMAICLSLAMVLEVYTPALADVPSDAAVASEVSDESVTAEQINTEDESAVPLSDAILDMESTGQACTHETIVIDYEVPVTCEKDGLTEGSHCADCGEVLVSQEVIEAAGHKWNSNWIHRVPGMDYVRGIKKVCVQCGAEAELFIYALLGDIDQNGEADLSDVQTVLKYVLKIQNPNEIEFLLADVNQSGNVNLEDAYLILKKALRVINNYDDVLVENVTINKSSATMMIGNTLLLTATAYPANAINKKISWSSTNQNVATVSQSGQVQAVGVGTTTITASAGGYNATCVVTVQNNSSPYAANCQKLINYILQYGSTNSKGHKFIRQDNGNNRAGIVYEPVSNKLRFVFTSVSSLANSSLNMEISANGPTTEKIEFALTYNSTHLGCLAYSVFDAEKYSQTSDVYFNATTLLNMTESQVQSVANPCMRLAFSSWELLLFSDLRMSMTDIGFVSYR